MLRLLLRRVTTLLMATCLVFVAGAFAGSADSSRLGLGSAAPSGTPVDAPNPGGISPVRANGIGTQISGPGVDQPSSPPSTAPADIAPAAPPGTTGPSSTTVPGQGGESGPPLPSATTTSTTTITTTAPTTTTTVPVPTAAMYLWDTAWQVAAKANAEGMQQYVDRLAAATGTGGANVTGFLFSVVNINQDINTPNGFGHTFGSFSNPNQDYLDDVETLIAKAAGRGLRVGIVVAWDGNNQFSVESGKLTVDNAYQYGHTIASQWTRAEFGPRWAVSAWIMGGDTTRDDGGEHGAVWAEVARGIADAESENGFWGAPVLFHTAPGQHLHYLGAGWLDAHSPQTGHCADTATAVAWMSELVATGARVWGNAEARYEDIAWNCNGGVPISPDQVLADAVAMADLGFMNFVYGHDARWNSNWPGSNGLGPGGVVSEGLQRILDEPGLISPRS